MYVLKSCLIFDGMAELGKASEDAYNWGGWLILLDLFNEWVVEGVVKIFVLTSQQMLPPGFTRHFTTKGNPGYVKTNKTNSIWESFNTFSAKVWAKCAGQGGFRP